MLSGTSKPWKTKGPSTTGLLAPPNRRGMTPSQRPPGRWKRRPLSVAWGSHKMPRTGQSSGRYRIAALAGLAGLQLATRRASDQVASVGNNDRDRPRAATAGRRATSRRIGLLRPEQRSGVWDAIWRTQRVGVPVPFGMVTTPWRSWQPRQMGHAALRRSSNDFRPGMFLHLFLEIIEEAVLTVQCAIQNSDALPADRPVAPPNVQGWQ